MNIENMTYHDEMALDQELSDRNNGRAKFFLMLALIRRSVSIGAGVVALLSLLNLVLLGLILWRIW